MLVLSRKLDEIIHIGDDIVVKIVKIRGNVVGLGIMAPQNVKVMRSEVLARSATSTSESLSSLARNRAGESEQLQAGGGLVPMVGNSANPVPATGVSPIAEPMLGLTKAVNYPDGCLTVAG